MPPAQYYTPYQRGLVNRFYEQQDTRLYHRLTEYVSELAVAEESQRKAYLWKMVQRDMAKTPADPVRIARIVGEKRLEELATLVEELAKQDKLTKPAGASTTVADAVAAAMATAAPVIAPVFAQRTGPSPVSAVLEAKPDIGPEQLKQAMAAFKKRLKVTKLDAESKLSSRALTNGKKSGIVAIQPPSNYPKVVWEELVKQGKLKRSGAGLYELVGV